MPQSLAYNYIHLVFSTKYREHTILPEIQEKLYDYITGICKSLESPVIQIGGITDHIHTLINLSKKRSLISIVEELKKNSSKWIKTQGIEYHNFYWQGGYAAFSVSSRQVPVVMRYIENQEEHHRKKEFQKEYIDFLKQNNAEYDERYVWD